MSVKRDLLEGITDVIRDVIESKEGEYPKEAVPKGTYVRSEKWGMLGLITDGFYSEANGQPVIIYNVLYFPNTKIGSYYKNLLDTSTERMSNLFMYNELEFDLTYYLMIPPVDMDEIEIYPSSGEML